MAECTQGKELTLLTLGILKAAMSTGPNIGASKPSSSASVIARFHCGCVSNIDKSIMIPKAPYSSLFLISPQASATMSQLWCRLDEESIVNVDGKRAIWSIVMGRMIISSLQITRQWQLDRQATERPQDSNIRFQWGQKSCWRGPVEVCWNVVMKCIGACKLRSCYLGPISETSLPLTVQNPWVTMKMSQHTRVALCEAKLETLQMFIYYVWCPVQRPWQDKHCLASEFGFNCYGWKCLFLL